MNGTYFTKFDEAASVNHPLINTIGTVIHPMHFKARALATTAALVVGAQLLVSCSRPSPDGASRAADPVRTDVNISGPFLQNPDNKDPHDPDAIQRCGEPQITQDVRNPDTLVVVCMGNNGFNYQTPQPRMYWSYTDVTKGGYRMVAPTFISHDGGSSWARVLPDPLTGEHFQVDRDIFAGRGPNGEMYLAGDAVHFPVERKHAPVLVQPGLIPMEALGIAFTRSLDGGKTWSRPSIIPTPFDAPNWNVDQVTGTIYEVSACGDVTLIGAYGCRPNQQERYLAVSKDQGRTWEPSVDVWNKEPPTEKPTPGRLRIRGPAFVASHGVWASVSGAPQGSKQATFRYSTDEGATWTERPLPFGETNCRPGGTIAADPSHRGGFAVLANCNQPLPFPDIWWLGSERALSVFVTRDMGETWKQSSAKLAVPPPPGYVTDPGVAHKGSPSDAPIESLVSEIPGIYYISKTVLSYGPTGALGLMWQQLYGPPPAGPIEQCPTCLWLPLHSPPRPVGPSGPYDIFLAISTDGGLTFGKPLRLNSAASPPSDPRDNNGNDRHHMILDRNFAYAVWGDWRSGELQTWFRKVPLNGGS